MLSKRIEKKRKKQKNQETDNLKASIVELYETKDLRIKYYGIKVGNKVGTDKTGSTICSSNLRYVQDLVYKFNDRS